jgi:hypothetical protein
MRLTSEFLNKRDISQLKIEELEDLDYHLEKMRNSLLQRMNQIEKDLQKIADDQMIIRSEIQKRK